MKFTGFAVSLALAGVVSAAALPAGIPGTGGAVAGVEGAAKGTLAGLTGGHSVKRQVSALDPIAESVASTLNGGTGVVGGAVGTVESTVGGAAGTAEKTVAGIVPAAKRQLSAVEPITEGVASSLNGGTGVVGSAVGTVETTVGGAAGTAEKAVADTVGGGLLHARQLGNLPATLEQTVQFALVGLSGNPTGLYGALANLKSIVSAGDITNEDLSNLPQAVQDVIAHLAVA